MKEKILAYVEQFPGARKREIASAMGVWLCDRDFRDAIRELLDAKRLVSVTYSDPANMEWFEKLFIPNA